MKRSHFCDFGGAAMEWYIVEGGKTCPASLRVGEAEAVEKRQETYNVQSLLLRSALARRPSIANYQLQQLPIADFHCG
jgi:hypothetical protein